MCPCKKYLRSQFFRKQTKVTYSKKNPNFLKIDQVYVIYSLNMYSDRQTDLSYSNRNNNDKT